MRVVHLAIAAAAMTLGSAAFGQVPGGINEMATDVPMGEKDMRYLDIQNEFRRLRGETAKPTAGRTRSLEPVPTVREDIVQGEEVRDKKGNLIGTIQKVAKDHAVVAGAAGKVEVDFASFAKNRRGLLINLPREQLEAAMARRAATAKPAG